MGLGTWQYDQRLLIKEQEDTSRMEKEKIWSNNELTVTNRNSKNYNIRDEDFGRKQAEAVVTTTADTSEKVMAGGEVCIPSDSGSEYGSEGGEISESPMSATSSLYSDYLKPGNLTAKMTTSTTNISPTGNVAASLYARTLSALHPWYFPPPTTPFGEVQSTQPDSPDSNDDQPLDLSVRPGSRSPIESHSGVASPNSIPAPLNFSISSKVPVLNTNRHILKAKPRLTSLAGRRTYTEDELQRALRDIQSGKLGTRRAAVIYGIPRSTLRNKVYKLAMEKERDPATIFAMPVDPEEERKDDASLLMDEKDDSEEKEEDEDEQEKELSGEEDKPAHQEGGRSPLSFEDIARFSKQGETESLRILLEHGSKYFADSKQDATSPSTPPQMPPQFPPPLYSMFPPSGADMWGNLDAVALAPYFSQIIAAARDNISLSTMLNQSNPYVGVKLPTGDNPFKFPPPIFPELVHRMVMEERMLLEEHKKREVENGNKEQRTISRSESKDEELTTSSGSTGRSSVLAGYRNESNSGALDYREDSEKAFSQSPTSGSPSPPASLNRRMSLNLRDVIAKSITKRFQQPQDFQLNIPTSSQSHVSSPTAETFRRFQLPYSSAIETHATAQSGTEQCKLPAQPLSAASNPTSTTGGGGGGKGTRPKRGKYRNYDRDSLVEAVRAVQRGEMSVHRAGSYYGVPHSTLEYKVKERHLMRPRKREPKNLPDEKKREDGSVLRLASSEKNVAPSKPTAKPTFHTQSPNGLKMANIFDSASVANPFASNPFPFWPPAPFHQLTMEYARNVAPLPTELALRLAQHVQEDSSKSPPKAASPASSLDKNTREVAESLYDGSRSNGNFLDGIIRSSLETGLVTTSKEGDLTTATRRTLLEQLYRSKYLNAGMKDISYQDDGDKNSLDIGSTVANIPVSSREVASVRASYDSNSLSPLSRDESRKGFPVDEPPPHTASEVKD